VVGRPVSQAEHPRASAQAIADEMASVFNMAPDT